jgi:mRNA interferase HigB
VHVIAKSRLREFWESLKSDSEAAEHDLSAWFKITEKAHWSNFGALKQTWGSADQVGNCVVFDVGNNRLRLIGRVFYRAHTVYVLRVMDHAEYDLKRWAAQCRCHQPRPKKANPKGGRSRGGPKGRTS